MFSGYDEANEIASEEKRARKRQKELEDTKPRKTQVAHTPFQENYSADLLGLKGHRNTQSRVKFSWVSFWVMLISISAALLVGTLIPGLLDELIAAVVIAAVNSFISAHRHK